MGSEDSRDGDHTTTTTSKKKPPAPTKAALSKLTRLAHDHLQKGDLQGAMEHFDSAADQAQSIKDTNIKISCYLNAGACLVSLGQYKKGLGYLDSASRIIQHLKLEESEAATTDCHLLEMAADVHYNIAVAAQATGDFDKAVSSFELCVALYTKTGSKTHAAEGLSALASCYRECGVFDKEIQSLKGSQEVYNELGECSSEANVCVELAKVYLRVGSRDECKTMLGTAKMLCLRVNDQRVQGKIYSQLGLIYTSLRSFDEAILNFERALPLLQKGDKTLSSQQTEASLLQNIGAAYNEKGLYSEAIIYHREAATLHGKTKNHNSESKSLCNLAFAQSQMKDFPEAAKSFSNALARAHLAKNNYLQFQACEGLGAVNYQMGRFGEAVSYFNQALGILKGIKDDSGVARERVMEKLSDASEALERMKQKQRGFVQSGGPSQSLNGLHTPVSSSESENPIRDSPSNQSPRHVLNRRLSPEFTSTVKSHDSRIVLQSLPLPAKRGSLPPIDTSLSPPTAVPTATANSSEETTTRATSARRKDRKGKKLPQTSESKGKKQDHYDAELEAYVDSYRESPQRSEASASSSESSSDSSLSHSGDELGSSVFSRHASHSHQDQPPNISTPPPIQEGVQYVGEGSLAIGANAREHFTTESHIVESGHKRKKRKRPLVKTEIVPKVPPTTQNPATQSNTPPADQTESRQNPSGHQQSKVCVIL